MDGIELPEVTEMSANEFVKNLQTHAASFAKAVATNEGDWIIKGFIDVYQPLDLAAGTRRILDRC